MTIEEYSKFIRVPLIPAGTFTPQNLGGASVTYTDEDIDRMVHDSNMARGYIQQSIEAGTYEGNPQITTDKPIPAFVNVVHQKYLADTAKDAMRGVIPVFEKIIHEGKSWVAATLDNIPREWASFIHDKFPFRSVEILSDVNIPDSPEPLKHVIRSIGFLDWLTKPAVGEQRPEFAVEFAGDSPDTGIVTIYTNTKQGEKHMETLQESPPVVEVNPPAIEGSNGEDTNAKLVEMQAAVKALEKEKQELRLLFQEEQATRIKKEKSADIALFCSHLVTEFQVSPALIGLISPILERSDSVLEFTSGDDQTTETKMLKETIEKLITMKKEDLLTVPVDMGDHRSFLPPDTPQKSVAERQLERVAEFAGAAKLKAKTPESDKEAYEKEVFNLSYAMALKKYGDNL